MTPALTPERVDALGRAKINLSLAVGPRRPDGYHEIVSVMQTVELADTVVLRPAAESSRSSTGERSMAVTFAPGRGFSGELPEAPDLVAQALALYAEEVAGARVLTAEVTKVIPVAAGLAGGSADAAAALLAADAANGATTSRERLEAMCRRLGSDVVFCLRGGTALVEGRGNLVSPLLSPHLLWWVLGISDFPLGSGEVYGRFDELSAGEPPGRPQRPIELTRALVNGLPKQVAAGLRNDLEAPALDLGPSLAGLKTALAKAGAVGVVLSGSGPTLAGLCRDEAHAEEVAARAAGDFARVEVVASARAGAQVIGGPPDVHPAPEPAVAAPARPVQRRPARGRTGPGRGRGGRGRP